MQILKKLASIFKYSDSQPTEITLGASLMILGPIATANEIGYMPIYQLALVFAGGFQLYCVSKGDLDCRIKASVITFSLYSTSLMMFLLTIGLPSATHYGWVIFVISSFSNLRRLKTEQLHRNG
jgi:hypothetical protein